jgi:type IV pilus assembly protein PilQ
MASTLDLSGRRSSLRTNGFALTAAVLAAFAGAAAATAQPAGQPANAPQADGDKGNVRVNVDDNNLVDLHVANEDLAVVLELLAIQSQKNIIASKNVSARVTANLYRVTFFDALDAILNANGLGYIEQGNFIYVYTADELRQIELESRVRVSKVIELNYLNATDAAEFIKPLLSETGQIKTPGKTASFPSFGDTPTGSDDYAQNAILVVYDFEDNVAQVEQVVRSLDTRPAQVLVEATILQTELTENNAFGVDFSIIANMNFGDFVQIGGPVQAANALIGGRTSTGGGGVLPADRGASAITSSVGNTAGPGGLKVGIVSNDVAVFLRVLDEVTDTTVISNPKILTLNRQPSRVLVGRKVGYLSTTTTDTASTQTVEFLDTGTQLYFRPFVTSEGMIRMELKPQISNAIIREVANASGAAATIPDEVTNELTTNVLVRDGQTVVLGGLFSETTEASRRQVPFLGDIPILGQAFRGNEDETRRNEIIFLVTPTIVNDQALADSGKRALDTINTVRAGSREGLLFWSRDRRTAMLNLEADELARTGDTTGALWKLRQSLFMNPNQPEAVALRGQISDLNTDWPNRSLLDNILKREAPAPAVPMTPITPTSAAPAYDQPFQATDATPSSFNSTNFNSTTPNTAYVTNEYTAHSAQTQAQTHTDLSPIPAMPSDAFATNGTVAQSSPNSTTSTYPTDFQSSVADAESFLSPVDDSVEPNATPFGAFGTSGVFARAFMSSWFAQQALKNAQNPNAQNWQPAPSTTSNTPTNTTTQPVASTNSSAFNSTDLGEQNYDPTQPAPDQVGAVTDANTGTIEPK